MACESSLVLLLFAVLLGSPDPHIVGGDPVAPGGWPAVVTIQTNGPKLCTGTLVAPNLILTAAHCLSPAPSVVQVRLGESAPLTDVAVAAWGSHPDFCLPADCPEGDLHDFGWIRLTTPLSIEPIGLIVGQAEYDEVMSIGQPVTFVGVGEDEAEVAGIKREVDATITSFGESGREFRAGGNGKDTCAGDSGGPALVQLDSGEWRVAGVLSRGGECGSGGTYGVPVPELCWLRDSSGVDLVPSECNECACVDISRAEKSACACETSEADRMGGLGWIGMMGVAILLWYPRRRGAARVR